MTNTLFLHLLRLAVRAQDKPCVVLVQLMGSIAGGKGRARALAVQVFALRKLRLARPGEPSRWSQLERSEGFPSELHNLEIHWPPTVNALDVIMDGEHFADSGNFGGPLRQVTEVKNRKFERYGY